MTSSTQWAAHSIPLSLHPTPNQPHQPQGISHNLVSPGHLRCPTLGRPPVPSHFIQNIRPTGPHAHSIPPWSPGPRRPPLLSGAAEAPSGAASLRCPRGPPRSPLGRTGLLGPPHPSHAASPAEPHSRPPAPPPLTRDPGDVALRPARAPAVPLRVASRSPSPSGSFRAAPRPPPERPAGLRYPDEAQVVVGPLRDPRHHVGGRSVPVPRLRGGGHRPPRHVPGVPRDRGALLGRTTGGAALLGRTARIQAAQVVGAERADRQGFSSPPPGSGLTAAYSLPTELETCDSDPHPSIYAGVSAARDIYVGQGPG